MSNGAWSYEGKRVAIAGCHSGMGLVVAETLVELGAEVHGVDIRPCPAAIGSFHTVDLTDWRAIDAAVAAIGGEIDALFNCAGLPQTFPARDVVRVNFMGLRHWTEQWLPRMKAGSAVATISSLAGMGYLQNIPQLREVIALDSEAALLDWIDAHPAEIADGYGYSKQLLNAWTQIMAVEHAPAGIRFNATMPSPTQTPMISAFEEVAGAALLDAYCAPTFRRSTAAEQALPMVFLNSDAAAFVSGVCLPVDGGFHGGVFSGSIDVAALMAKAMGGS